MDDVLAQCRVANLALGGREGFWPATPRKGRRLQLASETSDSRNLDQILVAMGG